MVMHKYIMYIHTYVGLELEEKWLNSSLKVGEMYRYACVFRCEDRFLQHSWSPKNKRSKYPYPCIIIRTEFSSGGSKENIFLVCCCTDT